MWYKIILFLFGMLLILAGQRFIIMHWPYGKWLFNSGLALCFVLVVTFIYRQVKRFK